MTLKSLLMDNRSNLNIRIFLKNQFESYTLFQEVDLQKNILLKAGLNKNLEFIN